MYTNNNYPYYSKSKSIVDNGVQYAKWNTCINYGFLDLSLMYQYILLSATLMSVLSCQL